MSALDITGFAVNGKPFDIYTFDNSESIKDRYATQLGVRPNGCVIEHFDAIYSAPRDIRIVVVDELVKKMTIEELRKNLASLSEMTKPSKGKRVVALLSMKDVLMMWMHYSKIPLKTLVRKVLETFGQAKFSTESVVLPEYIDDREVENDYEAYSKILRNYAPVLECKRGFYSNFPAFIDGLNHIPRTVTISDRRIDYTELKLKLSFGKGVRLLEVFDAMDTSLVMPYTAVKFATRTYFKMQSSLVKSMWATQMVDDGIYFRTNFNMITIEGESKGEKGIKYEDYLHGFIDTSLNMVVRFPQSSGYEGSVRKIDLFLERTFGERLRYTHTQPTQNEVGGCVVYDNITFNKTIFSHILNTTPLRYMLFIKEMGEGSVTNIRTSSVKTRYLVYLKGCHHYDNKNGVFLTLKTNPEYPNMLSMKYTKAKNVEHSIAIGDLMAVVLSYYTRQYSELFRMYEDIIGSKELTIKTKVAAERKNKKTGDSLQLLQKQRPVIFGGKSTKMMCTKKLKAPNKYAITCPPDRQVKLIETRSQLNNYIRENRIPASEVNKYIYAYPKDGVPLGYEVGIDDEEHDDKVDWYVCKNKKMYPGLQDNVEGGFPKSYVCCYTNPPKEDTTNAIKSTHILASTKRVPDKRHGRIPDNIEDLLATLGYKSVSHSRTRNNREFVPFLVVGVQSSPSSFFTCARNIFLGDHKPQGTLHSFLTNPNQTFEFAKQSLFDMTPPQVRKFIRDGVSDYKDPARWVSCVEEWGQCNIFLIKVDDETPGGDLVIPYHNSFYVRRLKLFPISAVVVMKSVNNLSKTYPYQCENLVKEVDVSRGMVSYIFDTKDPFIVKLSEYYERKIAIYNSVL